MRENKWFKVGKILYLILFLAIEAFIYNLFILEDFNANVDIDSNLYKYESIILVVIFYFLNFIINMIIERIDKDYDKRIRFDGIILGLALLFTLLSDTFLLHLDNYYEIGVTSFLVVQVLYLFRMFYSLGLNRKRLKITLMIRGCAFILIMLGLIIFNSFSYLYLITGLYFINLVMNFIDSLIFLISYRGEDRFKSIFVFTIGLLLFIGCDINVGLSNLIGVGSNIIWIFYLPSQVLISLSGTRLFNMTLGGKVINERKQ